MVFVSSDLHGCSVAEFQELLLWLTEQPNMQLLLGNHEALLLACDFLFEEVTEESLDRLSAEQLNLFENWLRNGGSTTLAGLKKIMNQDCELIYGILDYLRDAPLYESIEVQGRNFVLVHAGLDNFTRDRLLSDYEPEELLFVRPTLETSYFEDACVVFGHTPTHYLDKNCNGKAIKTPTWICIDT